MRLMPSLPCSANSTCMAVVALIITITPALAFRKLLSPAGLLKTAVVQKQVPQAEQARRSYLEKVYPIAGRTVDKYTDEQVLDLLQGLTMYYEPTPPIPNQVPLQTGIGKGVSDATKIKDLFSSRFQNTAGQAVVYFPSVGELMQHERNVFDSMDWNTPRSSWPAWIRESVLDEGAHIEVTHFSGNAKDETTYSQQGLVQESHFPGNSHEHRSGTADPSTFLDTAPYTTAWYYIRRGSGIFYAAGRTKTAVGKNHMLLLLLREFQAKHPDRAARFDSLFQEYPVHGLELALDATLSGKDCASVGLTCRIGWILHDKYDELMVWLARECAYDTLVFAASPMDTQTQVMELVDLRLPVKDWLTEAQQRRYQPRDVVAQEWKRSMRTDQILTIRDPFHPNSNVGVQPCDFQFDSHQMYCQGTMSEDLRFKGLR